MIPRPAASLVLIALVLGAPAIARAQPAGAARKASEAFDRGLERKAAGDWDAACEAFALSERLESSVGAQLNLVTCLQRKGHFLEASALARRARATALSRGEQAKVDAADKLLAETEARTPTIVIQVSIGRNAVVALDGVAIAEVALAWPIPLDPGRHKLSIGWNGAAPKEFDLEIKEAQRMTFEPPPLPAHGPDRPPPPGEPQPPPARRPAPSSHRTLALVIGAGGVVLAGAAVGVLYSAHDQQDQADALCPIPSVCDPAIADEAQAYNDRAVLRSRLAVGMFAGGAVAIGAATYLWLRKPSAAARPEIAIHRDGVAIGYAGRF